MKPTITEPAWDAFYVEYIADYKTMLRDGKRLAEKFHNDSSEICNEPWARCVPSQHGPESDYDYYASAYSSEAAEILSSDYFKAYSAIMLGVSRLRTAKGFDSRNNAQSDMRYESIRILVNSLCDGGVGFGFDPAYLSAELNYFISCELGFENKAKKNDFFPCIHHAALESFFLDSSTYSTTQQLRPSALLDEDDNDADDERESIPQESQQNRPIRVSSPISADWQLRCMQALCGLGLVLLVLAIVTWSPVIATVSAASLFAAAGIYAVRMNQRDSRALEVPSDLMPVNNLRKSG